MNNYEKLKTLFEKEVEPAWFLPTDVWLFFTLLSFLIGMQITLWII